MGSWGGAPTLLAEGHAKEAQPTRSVRKRAEGKEAQPTRREPKATGGQGRKIFLFVYRSIIKCFLVDFSVSFLEFRLSEFYSL